MLDVKCQDMVPIQIMFLNSKDGGKKLKETPCSVLMVVGEYRYTTSSLGRGQPFIDGILPSVQCIVHTWKPFFSGEGHL